MRVKYIDISSLGNDRSDTLSVALLSLLSSLLSSGSSAESSLLLALLRLGDAEVRGGCSGGSCWCNDSGLAELWIGRVVGRDVLVELLAGLADSVHIGISVSARSANADEGLLLDLVGDFRQLALLAADVLHDEFVEMTREIGLKVRALDDGCTLSVSADLRTEVLEDGGLGHTECASDFRQVLNVRLHTVQTTFLGQLHLWHLVTIVRIVVLALRDTNVGCHRVGSFVSFSAEIRECLCKRYKLNIII